MTTEPTTSTDDVFQISDKATVLELGDLLEQRLTGLAGLCSSMASAYGESDHALSDAFWGLEQMASDAQKVGDQLRKQAVKK